MKKTKLIILLLITLLIIIFPLTTNSTQINPGKYQPDNIKNSDVKQMYNFGGSVAGIIQIIGTAVSAGTMIIIGIRYAIASADQKAEYKERMLPYFIGAVLLFGASNVVAIIDKMVD